MSHPARLLALSAAVGLVLTGAGPASAHVTVQPGELEQGSYGKIAFRMPNERDVATTTLEVAFPDDAPIASVRVKPQAGWTVSLTKGAPATPLENHGTPVEEVVTTITWTAEGAGIGPDEFAEFEVSVGPLPESEQLVFKALQTYADGEVVRWIEEQQEGAPEPEKPAPVLTLVPASEDGHGAGGGVASTEPSAQPDTEPVAATGDPDDAGSGLAIAALAVAGLALLAALGSVAAGRRRS